MSVIPVLGTTMYLEDTGVGRPVLFLHGNPTSSYLWRHVIAARRPGWRCLAPDLIGMGRSGRPDVGYTFAEHVAHLDALLTTLLTDGAAQKDADSSAPDGTGPAASDEAGSAARNDANPAALNEASPAAPEGTGPAAPHGEDPAAPHGEGPAAARGAPSNDADPLASGLVVVGHDWGAALALDLLRRRPDQVSAVALMEGHLRPLPGWDAFDPGGRELFQQLRTPGVGERMVLAENFFVDTLLPAALERPLSEEDLAQYQRPYPDPASRRALLSWPRQIPIAGDPADTHATLDAAADWATTSPVPKLLITAPGTPIVTPDVIQWCAGNLPHLTITDVGGPAGHFLPEDRPTQVADVLWSWLETL